MIPESHPRYRSLLTRERMAGFAQEGIVAMEGLTAHGRGEAFDYLLGEVTTPSAHEAEMIAAAMLLSAANPVISVNGNTAALAAGEIADLQNASGARVEVNLFHRTDTRVRQIETLLSDAGVKLVTGPVDRFIPLDHDRGLCHKDGIAGADVVLVPLEDGDRAGALVNMGKHVIAIDLNPLSRTARTATLPVIDEVTRAIPVIAGYCRTLSREQAINLTHTIDGRKYLQDACTIIRERLDNVLD